MDGCQTDTHAADKLSGHVRYGSADVKRNVRRLAGHIHKFVAQRVSLSADNALHPRPSADGDRYWTEILDPNCIVCAGQLKNTLPGSIKQNHIVNAGVRSDGAQP